MSADSQHMSADHPQAGGIKKRQGIGLRYEPTASQLSCPAVGALHIRHDALLLPIEVADVKVLVLGVPPAKGQSKKVFSANPINEEALQLLYSCSTLVLVMFTLSLLTCSLDSVCRTHGTYPCLVGNAQHKLYKCSTHALHQFKSCLCCLF